MATLDTHVEEALPAPMPKRSLITKLSVLTGIPTGAIAAIVVYLWGRSTWDITNPPEANRVYILSMFAWCIFFLVGIGAFIGPWRWLIGKDLTDEEQLFMAGKGQGVWRYFRYCTDHKVVGIQYMVGVMAMLATGGTEAMLIRTNLAMPGSQFVTPQVYNSLAGLHGITMIIALIIVVTGPFGNFILPIMVGARDMAFPRLNALSWWMVFSVIPVLLSSTLLGGIPTGWSAYAPLSSQGGPGMNSYIVTIIVFAISSAVAGSNITATVFEMRAKGMRWNRVPVFVVAATMSVALAIPAFPTFMLAQMLSAFDRTIGTTFYNAELGGSGWLYQHLFWIMGHPEVYVILLPGIGIVMEIAPVFVRKPLFSHTAAVVGMSGIAGLSVLVWAHHMYISGWLPAMDGPFMVTTEAISVPTGMLFLVLIGTLWRGKAWMRLPMLSVFAVLWNFLIGGITGVFLSDVPADATFHGSMFVVAHFHYTLMGSALTGALGGLAYWFPKMTGRMLNEKAGILSFWLVQIGFQVLFVGMFISGSLGMPRRVADYSSEFAVTNLISTAGAYTVGVGMVILLYAVISSWRSGEIAPMNPWGAKTLEWTVPNPIPLENFETAPVVTSDPYTFGRAQ